ncbi:glycine--tRNA ligase subunit beta [Sphingomonas sp.]|uniref:glycine--tRNA ligase subunit beta n=1 Tax=Sphingomonas sp. TaxID=28214 RepID=UPI0031D786DF
MTDFLLELRSEEIPARMQDRAREDLARLFTSELDKAGLKATDVVTYATPRRLALILKGLPDQTDAVSEEIKGPRVGAPDVAIDGFLNKNRLKRGDLVERDGVYFAIFDRPGRDTCNVLTETISLVIRTFAWPKSMRWGAESLSTESLRWVRPLQGIVAIFGERVIDGLIDGVRSGAATVGHRFHHPGVITIGSAADYVEKLRACHVVVDQAERRNIIALGAKMAAQKAGLTLIEDEGLLVENAGLTEWPVPLLGRFDEAFLDVPPEVIQLTARVNQKYFVCQDAAGKLANAFVCTANIDAADGGAKIVEGNQKVLAARLSDARFFYETDLKVPLENRLPQLESMLFYEGMGTLRAKAERIAALAEFICTHYFPERDPATARRAGLLAKADLTTGMVGEFPELQGIMGGYYAEAAGEKPGIVAALNQQYVAAVEGCIAACVALADRIDSLAAFFAQGIRPTGSKDPFALRRAALQTIQTILVNGTRIDLKRVFAQAVLGLGAPGEEGAVGPDLDPTELLDFFADRLKVQQREAGVRHDLIDAVFALGGEDDLVRLLARVHALQAFMATDDGANLLAGYKRAANILKKEGYAAPTRHPGLEPGQGFSGGGEGGPAPAQGRGDDGSGAGVGRVELSYAPEPAEAALIAALDDAEPKAAAAVESERFEAAMAALATLRAPIDAFFADVTVNDADPAKRESRLALLARMRDAVHRVADFGKIEG